MTERDQELKEIIREKLVAFLENNNRPVPCETVVPETTQTVIPEQTPGVGNPGPALTQRIDAEALRTMDRTAINLAHKPLLSDRPKWIASMIIFGKKVVRRCLKYYLEPVCYQQTEFNCAATQAIRTISAVEDEMRTSVDRHETEVYGLQQQIRALQSGELAGLNDQIKGLQVQDAEKTGQMEALRNEFGASLNEIRQSYQQEKQDQQRELLNQQDRMDFMEETLERIQQEGQSRLEQIQQEEQSRLEQIRQEGQSQLEQIRREEQDKLEQIHRKEMAELNRIRMEELAEMRKLVEARENEAENHREAMNGLKAEFEKELSDLRNQLTSSFASVAEMENMVSVLRDQGLGEPDRDATVSYAQSGEDTIIRYILRALGIPEEKVTYLDLGANHAKNLSNTYSFYRKGARGVLLEANPELIPELQLYRGEDTILNRCLVVGEGSDTVDFHILNGDGLSSADPAGVEEALRQNESLKVEKTVSVKTISMKELTEHYCSKAPEIMNLDVEGVEEEVIRSIDFSAWRPLIIVVETIPYHPYLVHDEKRTLVGEYLEKQNYTEYAFTGINSIFVDRERLHGGNRQ